MWGTKMNAEFQFFYSSTYGEHSDNWPAYGLKFTRESDESLFKRDSMHTGSNSKQRTDVTFPLDYLYSVDKQLHVCYIYSMCGVQQHGSISMFVQLKTGTAAWFLQTSNYARPTTYCCVMASFAFRSNLSWGTILVISSGFSRKHSAAVKSTRPFERRKWKWNVKVCPVYC